MLPRAAEPFVSNPKQTKERRIESVIERLRESARTRAVGLFALCFLRLLAGRGRLAAQESAARLFPAAPDRGCPAPTETASLTRLSPIYRLLFEGSSDHEPQTASADFRTDAPLRLALDSQRSTGTPLTSGDALSLRATEAASWTQPCSTYRQISDDSSEWLRRMAFADYTIDAHPPLEQAEAELPRWAFLERHRLLLSIFIPITTVGGVMANSLVAYNTNHPFRISHEGWFGPDTTNGGADKASHLTDYFVVANLFNDIYRMLGYSQNAAILWGFGITVATGLANDG